MRTVVLILLAAYAAAWIHQAGHGELGFATVHPTHVHATVLDVIEGSGACGLGDSCAFRSTDGGLPYHKHGAHGSSEHCCDSHDHDPHSHEHHSLISLPSKERQKSPDAQFATMPVNHDLAAVTFSLPDKLAAQNRAQSSTARAYLLHQTLRI